MLIKTYITIALRCPVCGKMDYYAISRFNLGRHNQVSLECQCGTSLLSIGRNKKNSYYLCIECSMCEDNHEYYYPAKILWKKHLITLYCPETGVEIGFVGSRDSVREAVRNLDENIEDLVDDLNEEEYFNNQGIMYKVLEKIRSMSLQGKLTCNCGNNNLSVEVNPDRAEIFCEDCGAVGVIFAETFKDLDIINNINSIVLNKGVYKYIDKVKKRIKK